MAGLKIVASLSLVKICEGVVKHACLEKPQQQVMAEISYLLAGSRFREFVEDILE